MTEPADGHLMLLTRNEVGWIEFIRLISNDADPALTLARVQGLRVVLGVGCPANASSNFVHTNSVSIQ